MDVTSRFGQIPDNYMKSLHILKMTELPPRYQQYAYDQFGETTDIMLEKIAELRTRLLDVMSSSTDDVIDLSDKNLVRFLRARKLNVEKAMNTFLNWIKFRNDHPDWFHGLNAKEFEELGSLYRVMLEPDALGRLVCIFPAKRCLEIFTSEYLDQHPHAIIRAHMWFVERISHDYRAQVCGVVAILSFKDLSLWDQLRLTQILSVNEVVSLVQFLQDCVGLRLKSVSFFDEPQLIQYIWFFIQPLLTLSMRERFAFYGTDYDKLYDILPEYDGEGLESSPYNWVAHQIAIEEYSNQQGHTSSPT